MSAPDLAADGFARLLATTEFVRPLLLEAGAGTGKTATLVARVLTWCLGPGWQRAVQSETGDPPPERERLAARVLRGVVAITFTDAAAREMAERVIAGLSALAQGSPPTGWAAPADLVPAELRARAAALLDAADQLQVHTIHAFCRQLLARYPLEAGLGLSFAVDADGSAIQEVVEETVVATLAQAFGEPGGPGVPDRPGDPDFLLLASRGIDPREIAAAVTALATSGLPATTLALDPLTSERLAALLARCGAAVRALATLLAVRRLPGRAQNAQKIVRACAVLGPRLALAGESQPEIAAVQGWLERYLPAPLREHLGRWARGQLANASEAQALAGVEPRLFALADELCRLDQQIRALDPPFFSAARRALGGLLATVQRELLARGIVGFADLLRLALALLRRHPAILAQVRGRLDQLLVDEFQDTDLEQCDLIRCLALSGLPRERPGLFLVGDPKQSIYGWRSADLRAYAGLQQDLLAAGGSVAALDVNFRSAPGILAEVTRVIAPAMQPQTGVQPEFRPLIPGGPWAAGRAGTDASVTASADAESPTAEMPARVEYWVSWLADPAGEPIAGTAAATVQLEARALVEDLRAQQARGMAWHEAGILLRSFADLEGYLAALRAAGIPYAVSRHRQYYRRREIIDAAALVSAVLAPDDQVALLAYLRSAAVGVPDAAWIPLWAGNFPQLCAALGGTTPNPFRAVVTLAQAVARQLPPDLPGLAQISGWEHNLIHALACLDELRRVFSQQPADVFVDRLRRWTLLVASEAARSLGSYRWVNLERFFADLLRTLIASSGDPQPVLRRLRQEAGAAPNPDEAGTPGRVQDAVQVITIHQAKGLEFHTVYLLQMHKESGQDSPLGVVWGHADGLPEYRLFGSPTPGFDRLLSGEARVAQAELVRTLYVAMTRARERLVLVGRWPLSLPHWSGPAWPGPAWPGPAWPGPALTHVDLVRQRQDPGPSLQDLVAGWHAPRRAVLSQGEVQWLFPALRSKQSAMRSELPGKAGGVDLFPSPAAVAAASARLATARAQATARAAQPLYRTWPELPKSDLDPHLAELRGRGAEIVARDVPILLPAAAAGATQFTRGKIDLIYHEPANDRLVVVLLAATASPAAMARARRCALALQDAWNLNHLPQSQLWVSAERIECDHSS